MYLQQLIVVVVIIAIVIFGLYKLNDHFKYNQARSMALKRARAHLNQRMARQVQEDCITQKQALKRAYVKSPIAGI